MGEYGSYEHIFTTESAAQQVSKSPVSAAPAAVKTLVSIVGLGPNRKVRTKRNHLTVDGIIRMPPAGGGSPVSEVEHPSKGGDELDIIC